MHSRITKSGTALAFLLGASDETLIVSSRELSEAYSTCTACQVMGLLLLLFLVQARTIHFQKEGKEGSFSLAPDPRCCFPWLRHTGQSRSQAGGMKT